MNKKPHKWINDDTDELFAAVLELENIAEARQFFGDLLTQSEIIDCGHRWKAAKMLDLGIKYRQIEQATGMSSATISRIRKAMEKGMGGYRLMLKKLYKLDAGQN
jgi:TrpR-related protein YerC/YecD